MAPTIDVSSILAQTGLDEQIDGSFEADDVARLRQVTVEGPVYLRADVRNVGDGLLAHGEGRVPVKMQCARCAEDFERSVDFEFEDLFVAGGEPGEDEEAFPIEGDRIDLGPSIAQAVALALPVQALCDEACAGLCPRCGRNLNLGPCDCPAEEIDQRWVKLEELARRSQGTQGKDSKGEK